jgi:hypothetical protein
MVGSIEFRMRSRAYSVRCKGSGPFGPINPKKFTANRGGAPFFPGRSTDSALGANDSDGSWPRRMGSSAGRSAAPRRGRSGRSR